MRSAADVWPRAVLIYLIYRKASIGRRSVMWHIGSRLIGKYVKLTSARAYVCLRVPRGGGLKCVLEMESRPNYGHPNF